MSERFLAGGWRMRLVWLLALALPAWGAFTLFRAGDWSGAIGVLRGITGLFLLLTGGVFAWGLLHRGRPVIELSEECLEFGSIYRARRRRVPWAELERLDAVGERVDLTLRSGEVLALPAPELAAAERRAARDAIERRLRRA